jgi:hypothetical protein
MQEHDITEPELEPTEQKEKEQSFISTRLLKTGARLFVLFIYLVIFLKIMFLK